MFRYIAMTSALLAALTASAQFIHQATTEAGRRVQAVIDAEDRSPLDRETDRIRLPVQTLEFFGLEPDMKVIEFFPAAGYYTELLAAALAGQGELHLLGFGSNAAAEYRERGFDNVYAFPEESFVFTPGAQPGKFVVERFDIDIDDADMFLTFRNTHNIADESRVTFHKGVFDSLRSGGIYGVIDHTRRHNMPDSAEIWRRVDPVQLIKEVTSVGFHFVDYSSLHYRPDDELIYDTTRPSIDRYSDRFTLKFRKP